ncbi:uncharacterized protein LOC112592766 [Melanaphis sacchari]|uniref:uncharacterized protein LOC112592766 n=1 Tax=Melanaphis sacchari TaxID=742174 RepID=UPI000DC157A0|nr:uncharacterized protein LOC112592766 [Melanaphis sacchari]
MSLPLLKNGSRAEELKSCVVQRIGKVIMSNTCAFDTVTSIIMVAYCDSVKYSQELNNFLESNKYFSFISKIVKQGITSSTYSDRASIMISELQPTMEVIEYETVLAVCNTTIGYIIKHLFKDLPSALDSIKCTNPKCKKTTLTPIAIPYINIQITNGDLSSLQQDIDSRLTTRTSLCGYTEKNSTPCTGNKTVTSTTTKMHVFIELLNWIDENEINSNQYSAEAAPHPKIKLSNIPPVLIINDKAFELRGVFCYRQGLSRLRNSVGHYYAYGKRGPNNWEIFDDIRKKSKPIKNSIVAPCEYLVYTI